MPTSRARASRSREQASVEQLFAPFRTTCPKKLAQKNRDTKPSASARPATCSAANSPAPCLWSIKSFFLLSAGRKGTYTTSRFCSEGFTAPTAGVSQSCPWLESTYKCNAILELWTSSFSQILFAPPSFPKIHCTSPVSHCTEFWGLVLTKYRCKPA